LHFFQLSVHGHCALNFVRKQVCADNLLCGNLNIPAKNTSPLL